MSIESNKPALQSRATTAADQHNGKNAGKTGLAGTDSGGFSLLMNALSAEDNTLSLAVSDSATAASDNSLANPLQALPSTVPVDTSSFVGVNPAAVTHSLAASTTTGKSQSISLTEATPSSNSRSEGIAALMSAAGQIAATNTTVDEVRPPVLPDIPAAPASVSAPVSVSPSAPVSPSVAAASASKTTFSDASANPFVAATVQVAVPDATASTQPILVRKPASHASTVTAHNTPNESKIPLEFIPANLLTDTSQIVQMGSLAEMLTGSRERPGTKSNSSSTGSSMESMFGSALPAAGAAGSDYKIAEAAAIVPETALAETVSYWVSHDVQNAELTLDGFGDDPVQVSISIQGEQAQIDFRCDQPEVRQALESATAELKELLSNQGLNLSSVSVGSSGRDANPGDAPPRQRQDGRKALFIKTQDPATIGLALGHAPVGRSLDIFV